MKCTGPTTLKRTKNGFIPTIPCGQCLNCRLTKRDRLVTRCLLESLSSTIGQFWTLTFSDDGLETLKERGVKKLVKNFLNALRMREVRTFGESRLRYFGVLEFGETTQRPHVHMLMWNHHSSIYPATPYLEGLPRPQIHIEQWPHGHVDVCPLNLKSCRYVCKYVTKFDQQSSESPICFRPKSPALGLIGLGLHLEDISRSPRAKWPLPALIELDGKKWDLDPYMRNKYYQIARNLGLSPERGRVITSLGPACAKYRENRITDILKEQEITAHQWEMSYQKQQTKERMFEWGLQKKELRDWAIFSRALRYSETATSTSTTPSANTTVA